MGAGGALCHLSEYFSTKGTKLLLIFLKFVFCHGMNVIWTSLSNQYNFFEASYLDYFLFQFILSSISMMLELNILKTIWCHEVELNWTETKQFSSSSSFPLLVLGLTWSVLVTVLKTCFYISTFYFTFFGGIR